MHKKAFPVNIWFLADDLSLSAQFLTDKLLSKSIQNSIQCLISTYFYFIGIRNQKFYSFYFSKEKISESLDRFFPLWPVKTKPSFRGYNGKEAKWCRKCKEHYDYIQNYLSFLFIEYEYRFNKKHQAEKILEWLQFDALKIGIKNANIKSIVLPWKVLNPRYRQKNIINGYRMQYKNFLKNNDGISISEFAKRDVPEFLIEKENEWLK